MNEKGGCYYALNRVANRSVTVVVPVAVATACTSPVTKTHHTKLVLVVYSVLALAVIPPPRSLCVDVLVAQS